MEKLFEYSLLLDFYGALLTEHQREICRLHYSEDWSLAEIAESLNISRQGVLDSLRKSEKLLAGYEEKLHTVARYLAVTEKLEALPSAGQAEIGTKVAEIKELLQN